MNLKRKIAVTVALMAVAVTILGTIIPAAYADTCFDSRCYTMGKGIVSENLFVPYGAMVESMNASPFWYAYEYLDIYYNTSGSTWVTINQHDGGVLTPGVHSYYKDDHPNLSKSPSRYKAAITIYRQSDWYVLYSGVKYYNYG